MMTMAMQRASPTMISPVRYSGRSDSRSQASANMTAGPTNQFNASDVAISLRSAVTVSSWSYRTLARTGYIITSSPIAMGSEIPST